MRNTCFGLVALPFFAVPLCADPLADAAFIATRTVTPESLGATMDALAPVLTQAIEFQLDQNQIVLSDPEAFIALIGEEFEAVYLTELRAQTAALQLDIFTEEELAGIAAFYATSAGEALITKTPILVQASQQIGQELGAAALQEAGFRVAQRIEDEGVAFTDDAAMMERLTTLLGR